MVPKSRRPALRHTLSGLFQEAAEAWQRQDYEQAIDALTRAARLEPSNPGVWLDLGRAHGLRYDFAAARRCFERAATLALQPAAVLAQAGQRCQEFGHYQMAWEFFERASCQPDASAGVLVTLAELSERHARLDEAADWIVRALALDATHPPALLARARLQRLGGQWELAEAGLRSLLAQSFSDGWNRVRAWYELGGVLDRQGRYDEAMDAVLQAKARLLPGATAATTVLHGLQNRLLEMTASLTSGVLTRWSKPPEDLGPPRRLAVLCGHPRSGTTLLEQILDTHPGIVTTEETHVLHDEAYLPLSRGFSLETPVLEMLDAAQPAALRRSRRDYFKFSEATLGAPIGSRLLVDKNPALSVLLPAVSRIFPEARFLVALRDPRDVCLSCFMQPLSINPVSSAYLTLQGTVTQYASVMGFWQALQPHLQNPHLAVRYEDMVAHLPATSRRVLDFLDLPWNEDVVQFHQHARTRPLRSPSYADVTQPLFTRALGRWHHYEKYLAPCLATLDPFIKNFGYASP
ncbi:MAG: tetratricopeptide repeat-containing sulfotransferase family protein [Verrucomicrobiales bacterium]